jgi:type I restriction enzyme S subunit
MIKAQNINASSIKGPWQLPERWEWVEMRDFVHLDSKRINPSETPETNFLYLGLENVEKGQWDTVSYQGLVGKEIKSSCMSFDTRHILYSQLRPSLNKVVVPIQPGIGSTEWLPLLPDPERVNRNYLAWYLRNSAFVARMADNATGTRMPRVHMDTFWASLVPIPFPWDPDTSLDIQYRIVIRIESLFADLREAHKTLDNIRADIDNVIESALTEVFSQSTMKHWKNKARLDNLVSIHARPVDPRLSEYKQLPHIGGESIESGTCRLGAYRTAEEDKVISSKYLFAPGAILYSKIRPYLRKVALVDFKGLCSADIYPLSVTLEELLPRFLMWSMVAPPFTEFANTRSGRASIPKINRRELFSYELSFPTPTEQQYIVNYIDSIQESVQELQNTLKRDEETLNQVEQSILSQAFRGEL